MGEERDWGRLSIRLALSIIGTILLQATRLVDLTLFEALVIILLLFIAMSIVWWTRAWENRNAEAIIDGYF